MDTVEQVGAGSGCPQAQGNSYTAKSFLEAGDPSLICPSKSFPGIDSLCICPCRTDAAMWLGYLPVCSRLELDSCWEGLTFPKPEYLPNIHYPLLQTNSSDLAIPTGSKIESEYDARK